MVPTKRRVCSAKLGHSCKHQSFNSPLCIHMNLHTHSSYAHPHESAHTLVCTQQPPQCLLGQQPLYPCMAPCTHTHASIYAYSDAHQHSLGDILFCILALADNPADSLQVHVCGRYCEYICTYTCMNVNMYSAVAYLVKTTRGLSSFFRTINKD
jgi:hypothetical protein